jgi:hypothetical protein
MIQPRLAEHGVRIHYDLVAGQSQHRAAAHRLARHKQGDGRMVTDERVGDLFVGQHQPNRRMDDQDPSQNRLTVGMSTKR